MKTLIELYDERPLDNVLATEMFRPEETIFICPPEVSNDKNRIASLQKYFRLRGCKTKISFVPVSLLDAVRVAQQLKKVLETHEDCVIDISGGTDAALFAAGAVSGDTVPVITYSRKNNRFYEISNAPFARNLPCPIRLDARSCLLMAGGELLPGREDNEELTGRLDQIEQLFEVYKEYRKVWNDQIAYIQRTSRADDDSLEADGQLTCKANNRSVTANKKLFENLESKDLINSLYITEDEMSFQFADDLVRFWLRDMGSVLELQVYRACLYADCFDDVILSAVVNWRDSDEPSQAVTNEIDVMCVRGVMPLFISCKTCEIKTEALNELAILRDRFGGKGSRAAIVTSASATRSRRVMLRRAAELNIDVIEWEDITLERLARRLSKLC